ncbi:ThiF family adenylyltransferase [Massilia sp. Root418]|uniref:ThiF family adenylyltransferase n=1 Tax=Massilia sp. Root418 TaxID=1736532 RepID=UPI00138F384E|nr:ThiF family adenylyltransferase [Massilia sp. Root418]
MARERRLLIELAASQTNLTLQRWGKTGTGELCIHFELALAICNFHGTLIYPEMFPDVPAYVVPQKPGERWSHHQYLGEGVLCLQYGPDNWHPAITGADLIQSANTLLWNEVFVAIDPEFGAVHSRHIPTVGGLLRGHSRRFLVTPGLHEVFTRAEAATPLALNFVRRTVAGCSVVIATSAGTPSVAIPGVPASLALENYEGQGFAVLVDNLSDFDVSMSVGLLKSAMGSAWPWNEDLGDNLRYLILRDISGAVLAYRLHEGAEPDIWSYHVLDFIGPENQRLPLEFKTLSNVRVAIIGLGSLGSKVAVSLARAGVRNFVLVDEDIFAPHNLVRNELNWLDVGFAKVAAVARELKLVAIGADVKTYTASVAGQENSKFAGEIYDEVATCNLVIDATANSKAFVVLAAITKRNDISMVWGEVFAGGVGAMMARSRPCLDADALAVRSHIYGVLATMPPVPNGRSTEYAHEAGGEVRVASDADVSALAAAMTQFTLDTLCAGEATVYPVAAYLLGYRKYWEFKGPFDTIPIDCTSARRPKDARESLTEIEESDLVPLREAMEADTHAAHNSAK